MEDWEMVTITLSAAGAKNAASRLRDFLATDGINLKQTHAYEALAQTLGYANWNTLQALLNGTSSPQIAESRAAKASGDSHATHMVDARGRVYTAERLAEQAAPRTAIPFDPQEFDKFVGCYQFDPNISQDEWLIITRKEDQLLSRVSGQKSPVEVYPESETKFFALTHTPAQISFNLNAQGYAESLVFHVNGLENLAKRVDESAVTAFEDALQKYVADNKPSPEREVLLRRVIAANYAGAPNLEDMAPWLVEITRRVWPTIHQTAARLGKLSSLKFLHVKGNGWDVYNATFENGELTYEVGPLTPDNKLTGIWSEFT
jgi:hypothetical protein